MTDDYRAEELIYFMKKIGLDLAALMDCCLRNDELSGIQVYFLVYLLRHHSEGTYLTELCRETGMSKATLSALIKKLREKDYLLFVGSARRISGKKEVLPTKNSWKKAKSFLSRQGQMEDEVASRLSGYCTAGYPHLFTGTVMDNIRYGKLDATDEEVYQGGQTGQRRWIYPASCRTATILCSPATAPNLSQGQRQLLAIARAAVADPPGADSRRGYFLTSIPVAEKLVTGRHGRSDERPYHSFVIAHRLSTVKNSDCIMVMEQGRIIEREYPRRADCRQGQILSALYG